ncbi:MAG: YncE family protein [Planctomycetota bacterium]|nr:YncE family protein [Planctomycetota bacterium]
MKSLGVFSLWAVAVAGPDVLAAQIPGTLGPVDNPDGDAVTWVHDGSRARRVVAGVEVSAIPVSNGLVGGACGTATGTYWPAGVAPEGDTPAAAAFTPDATRIVVAHTTSRNLVVFDAATRTVVRVIPLSGGPVDVAVSADNVHAVTANLFENTASIVDLATGLETAVVAVGTQPACVRFTPSGAKAVIGNAVSQSLSVIDVASATELHRIPGAGFQSTTIISFEPGVVTYKINGFECPSETLAVHPDNLNAQIDFFDLAAGTVSSIACDPSPRGIAMTPNGSRIVVSHFLSARKVTVVNPATQTITAVFTAPNDLDEPVAIRPDGLKAAVAVQNGTQIVDLVTGTFSAVQSTASVNRMLSTPDGLYALAVGFNGSLISYATGSIVSNLNGLVSTYVGAVAPSGQRAAMLSNHNGEDLLVVNTNGGSGFLEGRVPSGTPPEGDAARDVAISADGAIAVSTNILSGNASVIDAATGSTLAIVPVGARPADVEITPDRSKAVVANLDSTFASIVNLSTFAVTNVTISTRGSEVEISPNGQYAYVGVVTGGDGVWRIDLSTSTVAGAKLATGDMGSIFYLFQQASGMTLSPNGATLAVCGTFTNNVTIIDTASWSVAATVPVGTQPVRAAFSADSATVYVTNKTTNTISELRNTGVWSVVRTIPVGSQPFEMAVDSVGQRLYVANAQSQTVGVVNLLTGTTIASVPVPYQPQALALSGGGSCLTCASGNWSVALGPGPLLAVARQGAVSRIDTASSVVVQTITTGMPPAAMDFDASALRGVIAEPMWDGVRRLTSSLPFTAFCSGDGTAAACPCGNAGGAGRGCANSVSANGAELVATGTASIASDSFVLAGSGMPNSSALYFQGTTQQSGGAGVVFGDGLRCVSGTIVRLGTKGNSAGSSSYPVAGDVSISVRGSCSAGDVRPYQVWYRNAAAFCTPSTFNLSNGLQAVWGA